MAIDRTECGIAWHRGVTSRACVAYWVLACHALGCAPPAPTTDAADAADAADAVRPPDERPATLDAAGGLDADADAPDADLDALVPITGAPCDPASIVDLAAQGVTPDGRRHYFDSTARAPDRPAERVINPCVVGPRRAYRPVVHRHRMRSSAFLRVSTDHAGTFADPPGSHDTGVVLASACPDAPDGGLSPAVFLGCDDGDHASRASTAWSVQRLDAGTDVFIVVATLAWTLPSEVVPPGSPYELSVEELDRLPAGAECDAHLWIESCEAGTTCIAPTTTSRVGRCVPNGTAPRANCRAAPGAGDGGTPDARALDASAADGESDAAPPPPPPRCDPGLVCERTGFDTPPGRGGDYCVRPVAVGAPCAINGDWCPVTAGGIAPRYCLGYDVREPERGRCYRGGEERGGPCAQPGNRCAPPLVCNTSCGICEREVAPGEPCDPSPPTDNCYAGYSCARDASGRDVCLPHGTAAGARCRDATSMPRCDGPLECTTSAGPGVCVVPLARDAPCEPRDTVSRCPSPQVCAATSHAAGRCVTPTPEPPGSNGHATLASGPLSVPLVVAGSIASPTDVDCYAVDVPAPSGSLYAEVNDGLGWRASDASSEVLVVQDARGRILASSQGIVGNTTCFWSVPLLDGTRPDSVLHGLAPGRYAVCVHALRAIRAIPRYYLDVNVTTP